MKITSVKTFVCNAFRTNFVFVKIETSSGIHGWGEATLEYKENTVVAAIHDLENYLVGKDPFNIAAFFHDCYRDAYWRGGPVLMSALSGVEMALWDIKGKALNVPVYELLGGSVRDKIQVYCWIGGDRPDDTARAAKEKFEQGYKAIKMNGTPEMDYIDSWAKVEAAVNRVAAIRDVLGKDFGIAVDFHGRVHQAMARVLMKELEPYHLMFIEEPVLIENIEAFAELRRHTSTPLATGERNFTRWGFKEILTRGVADIIQPDLCHAGGILEVRKIAAMAECFDVAVAPHCPLGPIAFAASLQLDYGTPNAVIQEQSLGIHYNQGADLLDYLADKEVFDYRDGSVYRNNLPGLGIEVNEEFVKAAAARGHEWKNPVWRTADGVVAEW